MWHDMFAGQCKQYWILWYRRSVCWTCLLRSHLSSRMFKEIYAWTTISARRKNLPSQKNPSTFGSRQRYKRNNNIQPIWGFSNKPISILRIPNGIWFFSPSLFTCSRFSIESNQIKKSTTVTVASSHFNKANTCGLRMAHDRWCLNIKLAEARWAQQQARERELEEVKDFLQWKSLAVLHSH